MKFITATLLFCLIFVACGKEELPKVNVKYSTSMCCNFWEPEAGVYVENREDAIKSFFKTEDISIYNFRIEQGLPDVQCFWCCQCPTGNTLVLKVDRGNLFKMYDLGFEVVD